MKKFYDLKIFTPFIMDKNFTTVREVIQKMIHQILLSKLTERQQAMLSVENYHYSDPNRPDEGKMQGLLEYLIFDVVVTTSTFRMKDHFYTTLSLYDLKKLTGMSDFGYFKREIIDINKRWKGIASIKIISMTSGGPKISFSLA